MPADRRPRRPPVAPPRRPPLLLVVAGAVAVLAAVAIIATSRDGGNGGNGGDEPAGVEQVRPVTVAGAALAPFADAAADAAVGVAAPELRGASFDGTPVEITADGVPKLVVFLAHWCPHCQREVPVIADWLDSDPLPGAVQLYAVSTSVTSVRPNYPPSAWLRDEGWTVPTLADDAGGAAGTAFGLTSFPYFVAISADGTVLARTTGEITTTQLVDLVDRLAATA